MINQLFEKSETRGLGDAAKRYLETGDDSIPRQFVIAQQDYWAESIGNDLVREHPWGEETVALLRFFIHLSDGGFPSAGYEQFYLIGVMNAALDEEHRLNPGVAEEIAGELLARHGHLEQFVQVFLFSYPRRNDWSSVTEGRPADGLINPVAYLIFTLISKNGIADPSALTRHLGLLAALSLEHPELIASWSRSALVDPWHGKAAWRAVLAATSDHDELCLSYCHEVAKTDADDAYEIVRTLNELRDNHFEDIVLEFATMPKAALGHEGLTLLLEKRPESVVKIMANAFELPDADQYTSFIDGPSYAKLFESINRDWTKGGEHLLEGIVRHWSRYRLEELFSTHLKALGKPQFPAFRKIVLEVMQELPLRDQAPLWSALAQSHPLAFIEDFEGFISGKSKPLREISAKVLAEQRGSEFIPMAKAQFEGGKVDARLGAAAFLGSLANPSTSDWLQSALEGEKSDKVRDQLIEALSSVGVDAAAGGTEGMGLNEMIQQQSKRLKLPPASWLKCEALPRLLDKEGRELSPEATSLLIARQSKHKPIELAPDLVPLFEHLDREKNADFALMLVEGFLDSDQAAADRWALTLGGLLGDQRIIPPLLSRIQGWCENSRHKLAEYAAQAISLLPGDEPLMVLDTLATRYRSKFKNVGKACKAAFEAAAVARGITPDELGDMVVPSFEFDEDGVRTFEWDGGSISAELGPDFKLQWFDAETGKSWKAIPAFVPEEVRGEVKLLNKMIRETVKGQTARLELMLVRQRRWPVERWRELFERHPVLKSFASRLVWGIYDESGSLLRSFRRYPNGLLADAAGELEELDETNVFIGMLHPLALEEAALEAWRAHLGRMKVKPPFPQLDRPVELLDPLHGNRKEITISRGQEVGAGTFRSRSEKRGWVRGSVIDAGGISSVFKQFPGAGIEVVLPTDNYWIGIDPMDTVELSSAYFVKEGTVGRGSYEYDEPSPDDERVLRFDQVPAIVYSETLADLKVIAGELSK